MAKRIIRDCSELEDSLDEGKEFCPAHYFFVYATTAIEDDLVMQMINENILPGLNIPRSAKLKKVDLYWIMWVLNYLWTRGNRE